MESRIKQCIEKFSHYKLDGLLVSDPINVTYLTGFRDADGYLLVRADSALFYFTNFLFQYEAEKVKRWTVYVSNGNIFTLIKEKISRMGLSRLGFEAKHLPYLEQERLKENLNKEGIDFIKTIDLVSGLRAIKGPKEISLIKKSVACSIEAFEFAKEIFDPTMTEKDLSIEIEKFLKLKGDSQIAFPPIIASGKNSAFPHYEPREVRLNDTFFLIDLGSRYYGYCADLTRVFFWGKISFFIRRLYAIILKTQEVSIKKIRDGVKACQIDGVARDFIEKKGFGKYFGHGLGHGVGLAVHEPPYLNTKNQEVLKEGMVVTVEPAIYIKGKGGIRLEDMVLVKAEGNEILSSALQYTTPR